MGRLWVMDDYTQSRVFMKSIIAQITKAIKSTKCYWQPPLFAVIMLKLCTDQSANDNQCETKHQYYFNFRHKNQAIEMITKL